MYYRDHAPPHFHAIHGESEALVSIETLEIMEGRLPRRAWSLVSEWASVHHDELAAAWDLARTNAPIPAIPGLD